MNETLREMIRTLGRCYDTLGAMTEPGKGDLRLYGDDREVAELAQDNVKNASRAVLEAYNYRLKAERLPGWFDRPGAARARKEAA